MAKGARRPNLVLLARQWQQHKKAKQDEEQVEKEHRARLLEAVAAQGQADHKGNIFLALPEPYTGWEKGKEVKYNGLERRRSVSVIIDQEKALAFLEAKGNVGEYAESYIPVKDADAAIEVLAKAGLIEEDVEVVTSLSEEKLRAAIFENIFTPEEQEEIFVNKETFALWPAKL